MVLRKEFHIQGNTGIGQKPSWAFNAFSAHQLAKAIAERGLAPTVMTTAVEGAAAGSRANGWGVAAGATLGIGLVTWAWWKSKPNTLETPHSETNNLSPDQLRCLADPYNTSAECAAVRSALSTLPTTNTHPQNPNAARASAITQDTKPTNRTAVGLPASATPSATPLLDAALVDNDNRERLFNALVRHLPEIVRNIMTLLQVSAVISQHRLWLDGLSAEGRANFAAYQKLADQFSDPQQRLQFLAPRPDVHAMLRQYSAFPDAFFSDIRLTKRIFLDFMGFAAVCKIDYLSQVVAQIEKELKAQPAGALTAALIDIRNSTAQKIHSPQVLLFPQLVATAELLKTLLAQNRSPHVQFALEHPHYIWITHTPMPQQFMVNDARYGKWVINTKTLADSVAIVERLLPHFANTELGTVKFELRPRGGQFTVVVYAQSRDPKVFKLVAQTAGRSPFWVSDEFCYEADAIGEWVRAFVAKIDPKRAWNPALVRKLRDRAFCESRGISPIQAEILWRLLTPHEPRDPNVGLEYAHVINGYFGGDEELATEAGVFGGDKAKFIETLQHVVMVAFENNRRKEVRAFFETRRKAFLKRYQARPEATSSVRRP